MRKYLSASLGVGALAIALLTLGSAVQAQISVDGTASGSANSSSTAGERTTTDNGASAGVSVGVQVGGTSSSTGNSAGSDADADVSSDSDSSISVSRSDVGADTVSMSAASVRVGSDLDAYAKGVVASDANVSEVAATDEEVTVKYKVPGRLLGFIPVTVTARVTADASGETDIDYPWYGFMTSVNDDEVRASLESEISAVVSNSAMASSAGAEASGEARLTSQTKAELISRIHTAMRSWAQASADASAEAEASGSVSSY